MSSTPAPPSHRSRDELVDRHARADVDADRRLVEDEQLDLAGQPLADQHLLLVAAGKGADVAVDLERLQLQVAREAGGGLPLRSPVQENAAGELPRCSAGSVMFSTEDRIIIRPSSRRSGGR